MNRRLRLLAVFAVLAACATEAPVVEAPIVLPPMGPNPTVEVAPEGAANADKLFDEVMTASEKGEDAVVGARGPLALAAYRDLGRLDDDQQFHVGLLQLALGDPAATRATCEEVLVRSPNHILLLGLAMKAATATGDTAGAAAYGTRLLATFDAESVRDLPEYQSHGRLLQKYAEVARGADSPR